MCSRFCEIGPLVPRRGNRFSKIVARAAMRLTGWSFRGRFPNLAKAVVIVAPHTSNWDFMVGIAAVFALGFRASFLGKHTLFRWPLGWLMRWLGGLPVDRRASSGLVEQTAALFHGSDHLLLGMSPEGTRKMVTRWRTGFYHIAARVAVPIVPVAFDYHQRQIHIGEPFFPTGHLDQDIAELQRFFLGVPGKRARFGLLEGSAGPIEVM